MCRWKNYENRSIFSELMVLNVMCYFFKDTVYILVRNDLDTRSLKINQHFKCHLFWNLPPTQSHRHTQHAACSNLTIKWASANGRVICELSHNVSGIRCLIPLLYDAAAAVICCMRSACSWMPRWCVSRVHFLVSRPHSANACFRKTHLIGSLLSPYNGSIM